MIKPKPSTAEELEPADIYTELFIHTDRIIFLTCKRLLKNEYQRKRTEKEMLI